MSEKFDHKNFVSAEQDYVIDPESGYSKALSFATDPVAYVRVYRDELIANGFEEGDRCQQVMGELMELEDVIRNEVIPVSNTSVQRMLETEYGSESWVRHTFCILKEAGFTKEEALSWVILDDEELTSEELLKERTVRYFIQQVYSD